MMRYITEKSDTHKSSIKKPDRKKRYFLQFILLLGLVASLSSCRTSAPRLDYQALARASILLGVDINIYPQQYRSSRQCLIIQPGRGSAAGTKAGNQS